MKIDKEKKELNLEKLSINVLLLGGIVGTTKTIQLPILKTAISTITSISPIVGISSIALILTTGLITQEVIELLLKNKEVQNKKNIELFNDILKNLKNKGRR